MRVYEFINEAQTYVLPRFDIEWEEANRYDEFIKLGKDAWIELVKKGRVVDVDDALSNNIENTDATEKYRSDWDTLEPPKKARFDKAMRLGVIELPIVARYSDGRMKLIAGNTRLTGMMRELGLGKVWMFDIP
jgi:hypothetical protein